MSSSGGGSDGAGWVPGQAGGRSRPAEVTRRRALQLGAAGSLAVAGPLTVAVPASARAGAAVEDAEHGRLEQSFDEGWLFHRGDASGAEQVSFDDSNWRALDLPHDWSIEDLPYATTADYNANGAGYGPIHAAHPDKAMAQSESFPATIYQDTTYTDANAWAVGNWVWAAWDYLGEAGIGKTPVPPAGTAAQWGNQWINPGWGIARALHHSWGGFGYPYPYFQANCGDIDLIGQRKPQNHWRAAVEGTSPVELLVERPAPAGTEQVAVWWGYYDELESWTWDVESGHPMTVHAYTPGDTVTLLLNGDTVATSAVTAANWATATFTVPYEPGELTAVASRDGTEIGRKTIATAGAPAALRLTPDVAVLTTSRDALAHVLVEVTDAHGRLVPDAALQVTFSVSGAGELAGVANGNPHNVDSFRRPSRYTWHSRALAILRPAKHPGAVRLTAQAPGLRPAALALPVTPER